MLTADTRHNLLQIVTGYYNGTVSLWQLSDALVHALRDAHAHSAYLGRRLAGNRAPFGRGDQDFAASVVIGQSRFLEGLVTAIQGGQYSGADDAALVRRIGAYTRVLRGTAHEAWGLSLPDDTMVDWVLGPLEHCKPEPGYPYSCVMLADGGPYPVRQMPTWPGLCQTPCVFSCGCVARTQGGQSGFPFVDLSD